MNEFLLCTVYYCFQKINQMQFKNINNFLIQQLKQKMDQNKLCESHQGKICLKICSHFDCNLNSRWLCQECVNQKLHQHNELFSAHIKSISEFRQYVKQEIVEQKYQETMSIKILEIGVQTVNFILINLREMMNLFDNIITNTQKIKQNISSLSSSTTNHILTQNELNNIFLIEKNKDNYFQFNDFQNKIKQIEKYSKESYNKISQAKKKYLITENVQAYFEIQGYEHYLFNKPKNQENFQMIQKSINNLQQQIQNIQPLIYCRQDIDYMNKQDCFLEIQQINKQIIKQKQQIIEINKNDQILLACTISPDEKYLVYSSEDEKINKNNRLFTQYMTFTNDSKLLILGNYDGEVMCLDFTDTDHFRLNYKNQIHKDIINEIKFINSQEILSCSNDGNIIVTNMFYSRQDVIIANTPRSQVLSIDFDFKNRVIVGSSEDRSIKFYYYDGRQLFQKLKAHRYGVYQMQVIQNKNKLMTLCLLGKLKIWQIDYRRKEITQTILIAQIIEFNNFITSQDDNRLIVITHRFVQIHDKFQQKIYQIKHKAHELKNYAIPMQQASKYILVRGKCNRIIIIRQFKYNMSRIIDQLRFIIIYFQQSLKSDYQILCDRIALILIQHAETWQNSDPIYFQENLTKKTQLISKYMFIQSIVKRRLNINNIQLILHKIKFIQSFFYF
ncbi:hypothetical protein pb186bvf_002572 [Paramecium bursaria]